MYRSWYPEIESQIILMMRNTVRFRKNHCYCLPDHWQKITGNSALQLLMQSGGLINQIAENTEAGISEY